MAIGRAYLFLGGPKDGEVQALPDERPVNVAVMTREAHLWAREDPSPTGPMSLYDVKTYSPKRLFIFGHATRTPVYLFGGMSEAEIGKAVVRHLFNDTGKELFK
jgi:hypothetical protein